jgi:thiamine biosynthesis lipoprotein
VDRSAAVVDLAGETMGTVWRVRMAAPARVQLARVQGAIERRLASLVAEMSHWEPASLLSRFNRAAAGTWMTLPSDFAEVMRAAIDIADRSGGAFDPAIGELVNLWGFGPEPRSGVPDSADIETARLRSGWRSLAFERKASLLRQPGGLSLDLSGIAKGYAVDAVARLLEELGIRHGLVEIGGECVGRGVRPDFDPWWVELETPPGVALPPLRVALHEMAVASSGNYIRGWHTIDPRNGLPVTGDTSVSVLHESAMMADAWASALIVLGPIEGVAIAERENLAVRYVCQDCPGGEWLSPKLSQML